LLPQATRAIITRPACACMLGLAPFLCCALAEVNWLLVVGEYYRSVTRSAMFPNGG